MHNDFKLLMISAMYENGGNTTQRFLDGHPELFVYPFESQLGTRFVTDQLQSLFPLKYRWPVFPLDGSYLEDYRAIIDEECKVRARTPNVSKFRDMAFDFNDDERLEIYQALTSKRPRSRKNNVAAFFEATFKAWKNYNRSGKEKVYVGYNPCAIVDADKILTDFPNAHILHILRNPWSAYADTKKRPVPMSIKAYVFNWVVNQHHAVMFEQLYPNQIKLLRFEDLVVDPERVLGELCLQMGLSSSKSLAYPSWNGVKLTEIYPWGTIRKATAEQNLRTAKELSAEERDLVLTYAQPYLDRFNYTDFI